MIELRRDVDVLPVGSTQYTCDWIYWDGVHVGIVHKGPGAPVALFQPISDSACGELGRTLQARDGQLYPNRNLSCGGSTSKPWMQEG